MKRSFMLFLAFCGVVAVLVMPGVAMADNFEITAFRDFSLFNQVLFNVVDLSNAVQQPDPEVVQYTPLNSNMPGWVDPSFGLSGGQHTYVIDLSTPIGGRCQEVPGLSPITGVSGLLVLYRNQQLPPLPTDLDGWSKISQDPNFLSNVAAVVGFVPGVSTAVVYRNCQIPPQVPEPGVLLFLGLGLIALAGMRKMI